MPYFYFTKQLVASPNFLVLNIEIPEGVLMLPKMSVEPPDIVMWSFGSHRI